MLYRVVILRLSVKCVVFVCAGEYVLVPVIGCVAARTTSTVATRASYSITARQVVLLSTAAWTSHHFPLSFVVMH